MFTMFIECYNMLFWRILMNYAKLLLLPIALASLCISADSVQLLQQAEINKKVVAIEKIITRDSRIVLGLKALGHAQEIYILWSLMAPLFTDNTAAQQLQLLCVECKERPKAPIEKIPFTKALWPGLTTFATNTKNLLTTPQ